ncbi:MAG: M20/M25/M40 family metallo-hydrolase [Clostridia bacterium]|nr:M20/M25/M40 family metallo-hydrolase [Clostridia bacterium]
MDTLDILKRLCEASYEAVPSSDTHKAIIEIMTPLSEKITTDKLGNIICTVKSEGRRHVVLSAHADKIGMIVTAIDKATGMLKVAKSGGVDNRTLAASRVKVTGKREIKGCVTSTPPHLTRGDRTAVPEIDDLYIDCGLTYEEISEIVSVGDRVEYCSPVSALLGGRFTGAYMDNSAGCTAVVKACKKLLADGTDNKITAVFTTREETGKGGAVASFTALQPDFAFITDVSFGRAPGVPPEMSSPLGSGGMICISPVLQKEISDFLIKTAEKYGIPYTVEVMGSRTMTDGDVAVTAGKGIRTGLVSVPLTNMHTPVEILDIKDVEAVASILSAAAKEVM